MDKSYFIQLYKAGYYEAIVIEYCKHFNLKNIDFVLSHINSVIQKILDFYFRKFEIVILYDKQNKLINIF